MLLAIDVGNTNTVLGVYSGRELLRNWRLQTEAERTVDEYVVLLQGLFGAAAMEPSIDGVVLSCVVPPMQRTLSVGTVDVAVALPMAEVTRITPIGRTFWARLDGTVEAGFT